MSEPKNPRGEGDEDRNVPDVTEGEVVEGEEGSGELIFRARSFRYEGSVPPPPWMEHYNRIVPGSAKQMMDDAHEQSAHRRRMEEKEIDASIGNARRGQWMGYSIGMIGILGGLGLAFFGISLGAGVGLALGGLAALAAVYVTGNWRAAKEFGQMPQGGQVPARQEPPQEPPNTI